ncbi:3-hydroxyacyl-CoA dehydrogenase [Sutcliffiella rhizosphaerae]|uniref:Oxidoreductase n=1 Tax=Sutcliffiella rhizosphaerae TaxID=2880967 RepID=A0ABN8AB71_9BACI|nr:3-hydroxyacyl-CoA dehydrogenase [Sutcliffiella rhizosphaerae]CAG9620662.1 putative oxidoreductase [Sutcliffiella rhizosphaerae]
MEKKKLVAFVTGGASGLGEATVRNIVSHGGKVIIADLSYERGKKLENELESAHSLYIQTDVVNEDHVKNALNEGINRFGYINAVVNCAGVGISQKVISHKGTHSLDVFSKVVNINLIGSFNVIRLAVERMKDNQINKEGERGIIINTASIAAFEGQIGQVAYAASKGGVVSMTLPLARELAVYGIRVVTIAPGVFHTPMLDALPQEARDFLGKMVPFPSRLGYPEEFSMLVQSIVENPMINGETIRLDGAIRLQPK